MRIAYKTMRDVYSNFAFKKIGAEYRKQFSEIGKNRGLKELPIKEGEKYPRYLLEN